MQIFGRFIELRLLIVGLGIFGICLYWVGFYVGANKPLPVPAPSRSSVAL